MDTNKTFNISMPKALLDAVDKQAEVEFRNRSDLIREAARAYIAQKGGMSVVNQLTTDEEGRIKNSLSFADLDSRPAIILSCVARPQPNSINNIFAGNSDAIKLMEQPPKLRVMGWDLDTLDRARPVAGEYLEVKNGKLKVLRLYRDGQHVFAGGIDFFGHAVNQGLDREVNINLLSVAELITNFSQFSFNLKDMLEKRASSLLFTITVSNPRKLNATGASDLALAATNGSWAEEAGGKLELEWAERTIAINMDDNMSPQKVAYLIYSEFCYFFGLRSDELWYVTGDKEMNTQLLIRGGQ